jgi:signal peptidase II
MNTIEKKKLFLIGFTAAGIVLLDQILKIIVIKNLQLRQSIPIIQDIFHFTYTQNTGAGFGVFQGKTSLLIWFSIIVIGIIFFLYDKIPKNKCAQLSVAAILGGTFGNLIDRINLGYVIDYLDFRIWPTFNIADSALTIGIIGLIFYLIKKDLNKPKTKRKR